MRYLVLVVGLLGALAAGVLGGVAVSAKGDPNLKKIESETDESVLKLTLMFMTPQQRERLENELERVRIMRGVAWTLLSTCALAIVGTVAAFVRHVYSGALLLLSAAGGLALTASPLFKFNKQPVIAVLVISGAIALAGLLAFVIERYPKAPPVQNDLLDDE